jgi:hypothetical protein
MEIMKLTNKREANASIISTKSMDLRYLCACTCVTIVQLTVHPACIYVYIINQDIFFVHQKDIFVLFPFTWMLLVDWL